MGCNTSQEQTQAATKSNADNDTQDESKCNNESQPQDTHENIEKQTIDDIQNSDPNAKNTSNSEQIKDSNCLLSNKNAESDVQMSNQNSDNQISEDLSGEEEGKAAVKIQAAFRGHKVRTTMKKVEQPAPAQKKDEHQPQKSTEASQLPSKSELEQEFDPNDKELCNAATRIQATFRGHLQRKLATGVEQEDVDLNEITKKVAEELDIDLTDPELNKAATKIQASFRGHKTRKEVGVVHH